MLKTAGCYEYRSHDISFLWSKVRPGVSTLRDLVCNLNLAITAYLGDASRIVKLLNSRCAQPSVSIVPGQPSSELQQLLLICQLYSELLKNLKKYKNTSPIEEPISIWLYLLRQVKTQRLTLKMSLSCLHYLSTTMNLLSPLQPLFVPFITILCKTITSAASKTDQ